MKILRKTFDIIIAVFWTLMAIGVLCGFEIGRFNCAIACFFVIQFFIEDFIKAQKEEKEEE